MEIDLKDKIAVISGSTGQLGRVMASTLASFITGVTIPVCGGTVMT